jgi:hypothetical protein
MPIMLHYAMHNMLLCDVECAMAAFLLVLTQYIPPPSPLTSFSTSGLCPSPQQDDDVSPEDAAALAAFMSPAALDGSGAAAQRTLADAIMTKINSAKQQQLQEAGAQQQQHEVG